MAAPYEVLISATYAARQKGRPLLVEVRLVPQPIRRVVRVPVTVRERVTTPGTYAYFLAPGERSSRYSPGQRVSQAYAFRYPQKVEERVVRPERTRTVTRVRYEERTVEGWPEPPSRREARRILSAIAHGEDVPGFDVESVSWGHGRGARHADLSQAAQVIDSPKLGVEVMNE